jgi:hypothetical protein
VGYWQLLSPSDTARENQKRFSMSSTIAFCFHKFLLATLSFLPLQLQPVFLLYSVRNCFVKCTSSETASPLSPPFFSCKRNQEYGGAVGAAIWIEFHPFFVALFQVVVQV